LRDTGANQTIDQVKLFGEYVRWFVDLPTPTDEIDPAYVLTTVDQAVYWARRCPAGPVHCNCMFRKPLGPEPDGEDWSESLLQVEGWLDRTTPYTTYDAPVLSSKGESIKEIADIVATSERGLIVVGPLSDPAEAAPVSALADCLGWPLLADIVSGARLHQTGATGIPYADQILASEEADEQLTPDVVVHVGGRPTSKRLVQFLARTRPAEYVVVQPHPSRYDPHHHVTRRIEAPVGSWCEALVDRIEPRKDTTAWLDRWQRANRAAAQQLRSLLDEGDDLSEPMAIRRITRQIGSGHGLVLGSSMPIRDADRFAVPDGPPAFVTANRGASGIDGLVATAAGVCDGLEQPTTLVLGDLALLHDLNSLNLLQERPLVVVVLNNDGGGIFHFLPIAEQFDDFEAYFGTPHGRTFEGAGTLFGVPYVRALSPDGFSEAYRDALLRDGGTLIEVPSDRPRNRTLHQQVLESIVGRVEATFRE
jgi:2-succinyl-5-enolpyruvyl-6-hydroxy-3-cyclohexene-1-carboxylate synthase